MRRCRLTRRWRGAWSIKKPYIIGNWKTGVVNQYARTGSGVTDLELTSDLIGAIAKTEQAAAANVVVCPPFVSLNLVHGMVKGTEMVVGAQNFAAQPSAASEGPVTGATPLFALEGLAKYVIIGHSESRQFANETWQDVCHKSKLTLEGNTITPIVCISEQSYTENLDAVARQIEQLLGELLAGAQFRFDRPTLIIAYEPFWAIGKSRPATVPHISHVVRTIRDFLENNGLSEMLDTPIIYGGSISADNTSELIVDCDLDGFLVGRASLNAGQFARIVQTTVDAYSSVN